MDSTKVETQDNQDKFLAKQKKFEAREAKRALKDQRRQKINDVYENEKAVIDITMADQKDAVLETPQDDNYAEGDQMEYKQQMRQIKQEFRNERKEIMQGIKVERQQLKEQYGKPKKTDEEEKEFLEQKILKIQLKYYKKFGQAPKDLLAENQKNGKLEEILKAKKNKGDSSSDEKN